MAAAIITINTHSARTIVLRLAAVFLSLLWWPPAVSAGVHDVLAVKAGAALAAVGAGVGSQLGPAILAAGLWAPPQHHHDHHHGHHGGGGGGHGWSGGHGGGGGHGKGLVGHGHGHGYDHLGFAHLPAPVVNMGHVLRLVAVPPLHDLLPRVNVALPRLYGLHDDHGHGW